MLFLQQHLGGLSIRQSDRFQVLDWPGKPRPPMQPAAYKSTSTLADTWHDSPLSTTVATSRTSKTRVARETKRLQNYYPRDNTWYRYCLVVNS